jgi:hypothetical protein
VLSLLYVSLEAQQPDVWLLLILALSLWVEDQDG